MNLPDRYIEMLQEDIARKGFTYPEALKRISELREQSRLFLQFPEGVNWYWNAHPVCVVRKGDAVRVCVSGGEMSSAELNQMLAHPASDEAMREWYFAQWFPRMGDHYRLPRNGTAPEAVCHDWHTALLLHEIEVKGD